MLERFKVPANEQVYVEEEALRHTVTSIFEKVGLSRTDAMESADVLVTADSDTGGGGTGGGWGLPVRVWRAPWKDWP